jgi:hypothetical protein
MATKKVLVLADLHCGHWVGLTCPKYQQTPGDDAPALAVKFAKEQRRQWDWFAENIKGVGRVDLLVVNGDAIDGKGTKSGGTEQITADRKVQVDMAAAAISEVKYNRCTMTYGTAYHVSEGGEDWEQILAEKIGAEKIEAEGHYDVNGLQIACKHFLGNSASPISRMTAMVSAQVKQLLWAERGQQPKANLILRSHIHRCYHVGEPGSSFQGWTTPALQGPGSKYGSRSIDGLPVDFGFLLVEVNDANDYCISPFVAPMALAKASVTKI